LRQFFEQLVSLLSGAESKSLSFLKNSIVKRVLSTPMPSRLHELENRERTVMKTVKTGKIFQNFSFFTAAIHACAPDSVDIPHFDPRGGPRG
jgi:hypothetical protein